MATIRFSKEKPITDAAENIKSLRFLTCDGTLQMDHFTVDKSESWWRIRCGRQAERWVRLFRPDSLRLMLKSYGFLDGEGCLNRHTGEYVLGVPAAMKTPIQLDKKQRLGGSCGG